MLVPCFNASESAYHVLQALNAHALVLLAVDDGSTDDTAEWLVKAPGEVIGWEDNRGKGHALVDGFRLLAERSGWEVLLTVDSDGQHDPEDLPGLIEAQRATGAGIVIGVRDLHSSQAPRHRRIANRVSSWLIHKLTGISTADVQSGYRLFTRDAVLRLLPHIQGGTFETETEMLLIAHHLGIPTADAPIRTTYTDEASSRSSWRAFRHSTRIFKVCAYHICVRRRRPVVDDS